MVCEYDASTGTDDLLEISRKVLGKLPRTGSTSSYVYAGYTFNYLIEKDLIFLCVAAIAAGTELVFQFLGDLRKAHDKHSRVGGVDRKLDMARMLGDLIGRYNKENGGGATKVRQMEQELEDVTEMMRDNIGKVMERGERIESLIDKTSLLKEESVSFRARAKRHNDDQWWRDRQGRVIIGICITCFVALSCWHAIGVHNESA